ncbi:DUF4180 domain-containing protein [Ensifer adhaerens]|jgi:hypothetical protein|uniref:DUF4180 domain-containing protein n=1 Tax=Ensifer adhaerens TaxID=106592 RepID=A0A9Q8Y605_ENSAD|nr:MULTISPECIES: DUF4180 domain-containing protein [Ensifer]KSV70636.1 hypothetical protein N182_04970 [Sinorhizobium sp. GL2]OWZ94460.1 alpha/beta hydrolase [Sinorhizobium sp. LM21]ANK72899.1 alpha/beta hydrolase [Ensifer adhaerens]KDP75263.1 alpha/beta hydrolase [Ensifer adhaerens]KQX32724.1 alpha/beta hydrolase [Ensifer sp. Root423]
MTQLIEIGTARVLQCAVDGPLLAAPGDANDFLGDGWAHEADLLAVPVERLGPHFLDLSTRVAGEVFQKFVNYRMRLAIVGDISTRLEASKALTDFVRETNKGDSIWFVPDFETLRARLERLPTA